jgi:hypothetical protein
MGTKTTNQSDVSAPRRAGPDDLRSELLAPIYARTAFEQPIPKFELPQREMAPRWAEKRTVFSH